MERMIYGFMPIRKGSKGLRGKNIANLAGRPLWQWAFRGLVEVEAEPWLSHNYEYEDLRIDDIIPMHHLRSDMSAVDAASPEIVIREWLAALTVEEKDSDIFLYTQATNPWTVESDFDKAVSLIQASDDPDAYVVGAAKISPYQYTSRTISGPYLTSQSYTTINPVFERSTRGNRQDSAHMLKENGSIYCTTIGALKRNGTHKGNLIGIVEMPEYTALEIDSPHHLVMARALCEHYQCTPPELRNFI